MDHTTYELKEFGATIPSSNALLIENLNSNRRTAVVVDATGIGIKDTYGKIIWTNSGAYNGPLPALQLLKGNQ